MIPQTGAFLILLLSSASALAVTQPFAGAWSKEWCSNDSTRECGAFRLVVVQANGRICGKHFANTLGLGRVDSGELFGTVSENEATLQVSSERTGQTMNAKVRRVGKHLHWTLDEQASHKLDPDHLILTKGELGRNRHERRTLKEVAEACKDRLKDDSSTPHGARPSHY